MDTSDLVRVIVGTVAAYLVLFPSAILYTYGRLSKRLAMSLGAAGGAAISFIALSPDFDPVGGSVVAIIAAAAMAAIAMRLVVALLDRVFRRV